MNFFSMEICSHSTWRLLRACIISPTSCNLKEARMETNWLARLAGQVIIICKLRHDVIYLIIVRRQMARSWQSSHCDWHKSRMSLVCIQSITQVEWGHETIKQFVILPAYSILALTLSSPLASDHARWHFKVLVLKRARFRKWGRTRWSFV